MINTEVYEEYVKAFYENPNVKNKFANCRNIKTAIEKAVDLAYQDTKRTLHGIGKDEETRNTTLDKINDAFLKYFATDNLNSVNEFEYKHSELCNIWCNAFNNSSLGTYGKAQKIINMTFKYLYCYVICTKEKGLFAYFEFCHMPLDSYTLEWISRYITINDSTQFTSGSEPYKLFKKDGSLFKSKIDSWSKLESDTDSYHYDNDHYYSYEFYQALVRNYISEEKLDCSPLQLEFKIWPLMQLKLAAESYMTSLDKCPEQIRPNVIDVSSTIKDIDKLL